jgi:hypothetical protein
LDSWENNIVVKKNKKEEWQPLVDCLPGFWVAVVVIQAAGVAIAGGNANVVDGVIDHSWQR